MIKHAIIAALIRINDQGTASVHRHAAFAARNNGATLLAISDFRYDGHMPVQRGLALPIRSEEHTSELQSLMRIPYAVFCLKKQQQQIKQRIRNSHLVFVKTLAH